MIQFSALGANLPFVAQESARIAEETLIRNVALIIFEHYTSVCGSILQYKIRPQCILGMGRLSSF